MAEERATPLVAIAEANVTGGRSLIQPIAPSRREGATAAASGECRRGRLPRWPLAVLVGVVMPACASLGDSPGREEFGPAAPPEVPAGSPGALKATRAISIGGPAVAFRLPDEGRYELVRILVDAAQLPLGLLLLAHIEGEELQRTLLLDSEPYPFATLGLRRHDANWRGGPLVLEGGREVWVGLEAAGWSGGAGLEKSAGPATSGRSVEPFLPFSYPHDRIVDLPVKETEVTLYVTRLQSPPATTPR
ncbi:MAG: hypothetical protein AB1486_07630 [Planctomycetota bacterium]